MKKADEDQTEPEKLVAGRLKQNGTIAECIQCKRKDRRDRLISHILYKHLTLKTWECGLWYVCFH